MWQHPPPHFAKSNLIPLPSWDHPEKKSKHTNISSPSRLIGKNIMTPPRFFSLSLSPATSEPPSRITLCRLPKSRVASFSHPQKRWHPFSCGCLSSKLTARTRSSLSLSNHSFCLHSLRSICFWFSLLFVAFSSPDVPFSLLRVRSMVTTNATCWPGSHPSIFLYSFRLIGDSPSFMTHNVFLKSSLLRRCLDLKNRPVAFSFQPQIQRFGLHLDTPTQFCPLPLPLVDLNRPPCFLDPSHPLCFLGS